MSEKDKGSESGIEIRRKSSGSDSLAGGVNKGSWNDFDDSGQGSSRRGTFDNAVDDDYDDFDVDEVEKSRVDLDTFMPGDDVENVECEDEEEECPEGDDEEEENDDEEEEEEENDDEEEEEEENDNEEEEEEYETEEEEDGSYEVGPSDESAETSSRHQLELQREQHRKNIKEKKKALINEYLQCAKHFHHLRTKNILLGLKIITQLDEKQAVVEKYLQQENEERDRLKEVDRLKRLQMMANCGTKGKKEKQLRKKYKRPKQKKKSKNARFSNEPVVTSPLSSMDPEVKVLLGRKFNIIADDIPDVSSKALNKDWLYDTRLLKEKQKGVGFASLFSRKDACKRQRYLRERIGRRLRRFSFMRSQFYKDVQKATSNKNTVDLMNLNIDKLQSKSSKYLGNKESSTSFTVSQADTTSKSKAVTLPRRKISAAAKENRSLHGPSYSSGGRRKFAVTKDALGLARSKSRMALGNNKQEQTIRLHATDDYKNLHHFKFEFADPRLTTKQASVRLREELIKLLQKRHIPTDQLRWPLEVKGVEFEGKNPYGRISLNYSRLSHQEKDLPHTAYRILLTNIAFLKTKQQRLNCEHRKNMVELENDRQVLYTGLRQIFIEIVDGLRIWASLCGISETEKKEAKNDTEIFIKELERLFDEYLTEMLVKLYNCIHSSELALRKLFVSEGKGEGSELHEFKDIMRGREKLKAEHKNMEKSISRYQRHSNRVLKNVKDSGKKLRDAQDCVDTMNSELDHLKEAVNTMIKGMYYCQETFRNQQVAEKNLKNQAGIMSSPALAADYERMVRKVEDAKSKRRDLQLQYNSKVREIEKIMPSPPSRFVRYKLRS